jgi:hypothetical protein
MQNGAPLHRVNSDQLKLTAFYMKYTLSTAVKAAVFLCLSWATTAIGQTMDSYLLPSSEPLTRHVIEEEKPEVKRVQSLRLSEEDTVFRIFVSGPAGKPSVVYARLKTGENLLFYRAIPYLKGAEVDVELREQDIQQEIRVASAPLDSDFNFEPGWKYAHFEFTADQALSNQLFVVEIFVTKTSAATFHVSLDGVKSKEGMKEMVAVGVDQKTVDPETPKKYPNLFGIYKALRFRSEKQAETTTEKIRLWVNIIPFAFTGIFAMGWLLYRKNRYVRCVIQRVFSRDDEGGFVGKTFKPIDYEEKYPNIVFDPKMKKTLNGQFDTEFAKTARGGKKIEEQEAEIRNGPPMTGSKKRFTAALIIDSSGVR